jgi:hypothetical protein
MKRHMERTNICKMEPNMYFQNSIDQNIILSLLPNDERFKDLIIKVKSKDYQNLYQTRRRLLMRRLSGSDDCKKTCSYCNKKFSKIQELREHVLIDCFLEEILEKNNISKNETTQIINDNSQTINNDNSQTINSNNSQTINNNNSNNITNITNNIDNSTTNIIFNINPLISFDKSWDLSFINSIQKQLEIVCSEILYTKLFKEVLKNKKNLNIVYDKKNNIGFVYNNEKYTSMNINDITEKSMEKLNENLLELNNNVKNYKNEDNYPEYEKYSIENEKKINNKFTDFKDKPGVKKNVVNFLSEILDNNKDKAMEIFEKINNKIEE